MQDSVSFIELGSPDTERTSAFFQRVFGWTFSPMGEGGGWFQTPTIRVGLHAEPQPQMYVFFNVLDLEQAMLKVREAGGEADPPQPETSGFGRFSSCRDPRGMRFGLHQPVE